MICLKNMIVGSLVLLQFLSFSCASREALPTVISETGLDIQVKEKIEAAVKEPLETMWEDLIKAAQKEGKLYMYTSSPPDARQALEEGFRKAYGISVESVAGRGTEVAEKIIRERRAGLYLADVYQGGMGITLLSLKPAGVTAPLDTVLIHPDVTNPEKIKKIWFGGKLPFADRDRHAFFFLGYPTPPFAINTNLIKPAELISYQDLLNPKWKGKIVMEDPTQAGSGGRHFGVAVTHLVSLDFMRQLAKQEPMITANVRLNAEWLAQGKYAIMLPASVPVLQVFVDAGAPVTFVTPKEGTYLSTGYGSLAILKDPPHPNAAKLFINWLLTKEAQTAYSRDIASQSLREDVPIDHLLEIVVRKPGVPYHDGGSEDFTLTLPQKYQEAREIFGPLMK